MAVKISSSIPKTSIGRVIGVARVVGARSSGMTRDAISSKLNLKAGTGSANNRVIAARKFGLIKVGPKGYVLTELGSRFSTSRPERKDVEAAIRSVDVFDKLVNRFGQAVGNQSPEDIRGALKGLGVSEAELDTATRVFVASWGYQPTDAEVRPTVQPSVVVAAEEEPVASVNQASPNPLIRGTIDGSKGTAVRDEALQPIIRGREAPRNVGVPFADHPLVRSVLAEAPNVDKTWPAARRDAWLNMLRTAIDFVYGETGELG